jgi:hypothetical protein
MNTQKNRNLPELTVHLFDQTNTKSLSTLCHFDIDDNKVLIPKLNCSISFDDLLESNPQVKINDEWYGNQYTIVKFLSEILEPIHPYYVKIKDL